MATASAEAMLSLKRGSPQVEGVPVQSKLSLAVIGTPSKGPSGLPVFSRRSAAAAAFLARAMSVTTTAFSAPLCLAYWSRHCSSRAWRGDLAGPQQAGEFGGGAEVKGKGGHRMDLLSSQARPN